MRRSIADAIVLLKRAEKQLKTVSERYNSSLKSGLIDPELPGDTNDFLNSCRSALDYLAWDIFTEKCKPGLSEDRVKDLEHKVQFPSKPTRKSFNKAVKDTFPDLKKNSPDIVDVLRDAQCFSTPYNKTWIYALRNLNNGSKHRHLTVQSNQETLYAKDLHVKFGGTSIIMKDSTFVMPKGTVLFDLGGSQITSEDLDNHPAVINMEINLSNDIVFVDIRRPVLSTLEEIYEGSSNVTKRLIPLLS
ncbi:hypothetical protein [Paenibacillus xylanilyticus]|uniref:hypothetical protein n=1 Tax=Paenibacillus xylanilyticus TaxID=248903 RepID=UPI00129E4CE6|nr:hypothetical protein [Paenibacillus xylanilyticus]